MRKGMHALGVIALMASMVIAASPAAAQSAVEPDREPVRTRSAPIESNVYVYGGGLSVSRGFPDRYFQGLFINQAAGDLGLHLDTVTIQREQNATFASAGISGTIAEGVRIKGMAGTSTFNSNILPEVYASGEIRIQKRRTILTTGLAFRSFRNGVDEYMPSVDVARYFTIGGDRGGYYAVQARFAYAVLPQRDAPSFSLGITTVRRQGFSAGVTASVGRLAYSSFQGPGAQSTFWGVSPGFGIRVSRRLEVVVRGDYSRNDFFETRGGFIGLKLRMN